MCALKEIGYPKRISLGYLLLFKLIATLCIITVRMLQILAAFYSTEFWLH
jgi:hypothetical protein